MEINPQWSPDGSRIAYMAGQIGIGTTSVWTMRPDGSDMLELTEPWTAVPAWSPDGAYLAFLGVRDEDAEIKVTEADGGDVLTLGLSARALGFVSWTK